MVRTNKVVIIDTDPGTDDAVALLMALAPAGRDALDVAGITTVGGNASLARTTRNTLAILEHIGRTDITVAGGASRPLRGRFPYAYSFHGPGGLSVRLPSPKMLPDPRGAVELLREVLAGPEPVTLIALGPLTNVARLLMQHPETARGIAQLVVMGGAVGVPGNITPHAEFNFYSDPQAAREVLSSGLQITLVDLAVCRRAVLPRQDVARLHDAGREGKLAGNLLENWFWRHPEAGTFDLCDPLAVAVAMEPDILDMGPGRVEVE